MATDKSKIRKAIIYIVILVALLVITQSLGIDINEIFPSTTSASTAGNTIAVTESQGSILGTFTITMIDVGQADSLLLEQEGKTALIDCGTQSTGQDVVEYLNNHGISRLDYLIATHPHDDHMGGMSTVIKNFDIKTIIMPKITKNSITSNWYLALTQQINSGVKTNKFKVVYPKVGMKIKLGKANLTILGPSEEPEDNINNYSIVIKASFGEIDALFTGDMETDYEAKLLKSNVDLNAEILKLGHHGSSTSTGDDFLSAVSPKYALVSAKVGNRYDHPSQSTMAKLKKNKIPIYRTDECGTVVVTITSSSVSFSTKQGDYLSGPELAKKRGVN